MRFLPISLLAIVLVGCVSYPKKLKFKEAKAGSIEIDNPYFSNGLKDYVYRADIKVFQKAFSGIFIVKKLGGLHHRIAFTTEMGHTIFDFEFQGDHFIINRILPEMDKKMLTNVLKRDFFALIHENPVPLGTFSKENTTMVESRLLGKKHYYLANQGQLRKIIRTANGKERTTFLFSGINDNIASEIQILHHGVKFEIALKGL